MSNINQFVLAILGFKICQNAPNTCTISNRGTDIVCRNVEFSSPQFWAGVLLRWLFAATGIGAIILWVLKCIYSDASDAQSLTQSVAMTFQAANAKDNTKDPQKQGKYDQTIKRQAMRHGFDVRQVGRKVQPDGKSLAQA
ncbi:MAG: hypothetical protein LBB26_03880 [Puniceicoccales bacterium]|jgi:hypothetical protein|nr:hypothetical protein [Puniceicoccales bacterium]